MSNTIPYMTIEDHLLTPRQLKSLSVVGFHVKQGCFSYVYQGDKVSWILTEQLCSDDAARYDDIRPTMTCDEILYELPNVIYYEGEPFKFEMNGCGSTMIEVGYFNRTDTNKHRDPETRCLSMARRYKLRDALYDLLADIFCREIIKPINIDSHDE